MVYLLDGTLIHPDDYEYAELVIANALNFEPQHFQGVRSLIWLLHWKRKTTVSEIDIFLHLAFHWKHYRQ